MIGPQKIGHALEGWEIRKSKFDCGHELKRFLKWISSFLARHLVVFWKYLWFLQFINSRKYCFKCNDKNDQLIIESYWWNVIFFRLSNRIFLKIRTYGIRKSEKYTKWKDWKNVKKWFDKINILLLSSRDAVSLSFKNQYIHHFVKSACNKSLNDCQSFSPP